MSGIAGSLVRTDDGPSDLALVWAMISALALRSPGGRQLGHNGNRRIRPRQLPPSEIFRILPEIWLSSW